MALDSGQSLAREVGGPITLAERSEPEKEETGTATHLQHPARMQRPQAGRRRVRPLAHLSLGDRTPGVAAAPTGEIEIRRLTGRPGFAIRVVPDALPAPCVPRAADVGRGGFGVGDDVGLELLAFQLGNRLHYRLADGRMAFEGCLDLFELDPVAADLHLLVAAAEELERSLSALAHPVAGAVPAFARRSAEGGGEESGRRLLRPTEVGAGEAGTRDVELAGRAEGHRAQEAINDVKAGGGDRSANGNGPGLAFHRVDRGPDGRLCRPI